MEIKLKNYTLEARLARTTLAERQVRLEQQRARLQMEENRLRDAERKARTRRLIEAGGLVDKAGLISLEASVLYGALLQIAADARSPERVEGWRLVGGKAFDREAKAKMAGREPLVLTLPFLATAPLQAQLRRCGFRWSKILRHWEGMALYSEAMALASEHGGSVQRVAAEERPSGHLGGPGEGSAPAPSPASSEGAPSTSA